MVYTDWRTPDNLSSPAAFFKAAPPISLCLEEKKTELAAKNQYTTLHDDEHIIPLNLRVLINREPFTNQHMWMWFSDGDGFEDFYHILTGWDYKSNLKFKETVGIFRWNEDGSQLSTTSLYYSLVGYMANGNMITLITKMTISM